MGGAATWPPKPALRAQFGKYFAAFCARQQCQQQQQVQEELQSQDCKEAQVKFVDVLL